MTEPKLKPCPYCDGKGYYYQESSYGMELVQCNCQNTQTNEEYLRSLNTEQLADVFFDYRYAYATPRQKLWMSAGEECIKTDIVKWLKEKHDGNMGRNP